jgi:large subunit ribosomal protein L29
MVILLEIKELRKLSTEDLVKKIKDTKEELFTKRMQHASGTLEKPVELKVLRRDVARMKTILKEREIDGGNK